MPVVMIPLLALFLTSCSRETGTQDGLRLTCFVVITLVPLCLLVFSNRVSNPGADSRALSPGERARNQSRMGGRIIQTGEDPPRPARRVNSRKPPVP